jgi:DNA repair protein RecO (recombination protein O)
MIHSTRAIVLRTVKYGETSFIVSLYTELFGMQSCMVQGVRKASKKGNNKAGFFTVGALLQIAMYHQGNKQLQRISDYQFDAVHTSISTSIVKNAIMVLMMEVVHHTLNEPEPNAELFLYLENVLQYIEEVNEHALTWMPSYFCIQYASWLGFGINGKFSSATPLLHLQDGMFVPEQTSNGQFCTTAESEIISKLLHTHLADLNNLQMDNSLKRQVLHHAIEYLQFHIPHMATVKSLAVLEAVFS